MRNFGRLGPHHHPLFFVLPRWYAPRKPVLPLNSIDRFAIRTARLENTSHWQLFEVQIRQCITRHSQPQLTPEVSMHTLEQELRTICSNFSLKGNRELRWPLRFLPLQPGCGKPASRPQPVEDTPFAISLSVGLISPLSELCTKPFVRRIGKINVINCRRFLTEGDDLALHGRTFDWFRKIRLLCPN